MIPRTLYTRLAHVELTMVAASSPAVVWLPSAPPSVQEWTANLARVDGQCGSLGLIALPEKATDEATWMRECRTVWDE